ncbi:hypothetical protein [Bacteroides sp. 2_2_4]|uniref:hypothetical protein n=1 Tax=Bacteroides sp. 2_2_4 TaxID=469590 RepID=UPI00158598AE|nr:hypothetical protein [Bacteroides sp. 2_2_4]
MPVPETTEKPANSRNIWKMLLCLIKAQNPERFCALIKHNCSSGFPAQKLHSIRKTGRTRRKQHHVSMAAEACAAFYPNRQTRSIIKHGNPAPNGCTPD